MEFIKKLTEYFKNIFKGKDRKKLTDNLIIIIISGIIIIIVGGSIFGKSNSSTKEYLTGSNQETEVLNKNTVDTLQQNIEKELEEILGKIDGVGEVDVMITYASGREIVPAYDIKKSENNTDERDNNGGTRKTTENDYENNIVYEEVSGGIKKPIILKDIEPEIRGVVVVADGAEKVEVKENLCRAVQALMDVPIHRIQIFERKNK